MSDLNNIDKLLKDNFDDFTPDAPDVWQGIEQGVQAAQSAQVAGSVAAVKGTSLVVKIIATVAISASVATGYILLTKDNAPVESNPITTATTTPRVEEETPVVVNEPKESTTFAQETPAIKKAGKASSQPQKYDAETITSSDPVSGIQNVEPSVIIEQPQSTPKSTEKISVVNNTPPVIAKENVVKDLQEEADSDEDPKAENHVVKEQEAFAEVTIPNTFTPNGDGKNDTYVILIENEILYSLTIMDKNGNKVFESSDKNIQWDGRDYKSGTACPSGTYYKVFRYKLKGAQSEQTTTGTITLIN